MATTTVKKLKVKTYDRDSSYKVNIYCFSFAFASLKGSGAGRYAETKHSPLQCKDQLLDILLASREGLGRPHSPTYSSNWKPDEEKTLLLINVPKANVSAPLYSKVIHLVNYFEDKAKWPRSVIIPVDYRRGMISVLFVGTKRWQASPPLLSFLTLLLRLPNTIYGLKEFKELEGGKDRDNKIEKLFKALSSYNTKHGPNTNTDIMHFVNVTTKANSLPEIIMRNYRQIFYKDGELYRWVPTGGSASSVSVHGYGGIYVFFNAVKLLLGEFDHLRSNDNNASSLCRFNVDWVKAFIKVQKRYLSKRNKS